ncbi:MAG: XisI protein [Chloroflexota bacterium]
MDKLDRYREYIKAILHRYSQYKPSYGDVEMEYVIDPEKDHYHLLTIGWKGYERIHGTVLHIDIKDGKIWIQHNGTEEHIANTLVDMGVPKEDIVLAFHAPYKRHLTGFATGLS